MSLQPTKNKSANKTPEAFSGNESMYNVRVDHHNTIWWTTLFIPKEKTSDVDEVLSYLYQLFSENPDTKYDMIIDTETVKNEKYTIPKEYRIKFNELAKHPQLRKIAIAGANRYMQIFGTMLARFSNKWGNFRFFSSTDDALRWIRSDK